MTLDEIKEAIRMVTMGYPNHPSIHRLSECLFKVIGTEDEPVPQAVAEPETVKQVKVSKPVEPEKRKPGRPRKTL